MVSRVIPVDPFDLVIFGGTGDLAKRKIIRVCFGVLRRVLTEARIIGAARASLDTPAYRALLRDAILEFGVKNPDADVLADFLDRLSMLQSTRWEAGWEDLAKATDTVRAFYFSVNQACLAPGERLHKRGIALSDSRIVVEKPFGRDLESSQQLNATLSEHFTETQIYRIDHYLGKETVQNLMAIRFGNMLFEPLWNAQYVDHIQITVAETVGVGGRGEYYDKSGAMRDMVQNHLMQLLCLIAMEPPAQFNPNAVRDEKLKVIRALDAVPAHHIVRGQYASPDGQETYRQDVNNPRSFSESFLALKTHIGNWRWAGTPFYLRTGKRLRARSSEIAVVFKETPHSIFGPEAGSHRNAW